MKEIFTGLVLICGGLTVIGGFLAAVWYKFVKPGLVRDLIEPVQKTLHQVTVNHHSSPEPTILDRLDDVREDLKSDIDITRTDVKTLVMALEGHANWSEEWTRKIEDDLARIHNDMGRLWVDVNGLKTRMASQGF